MGKSINYHDISIKLIDEIDKAAKMYAGDFLRALAVISGLIMDKRLYRDARDSKNNAEDRDGNVWKEHSIYNGWQTISKVEKNKLIADGVFMDTLITTLEKYDASSEAGFTTYFCKNLYFRMKDHIKNLDEENKCFVSLFDRLGSGEKGDADDSGEMSVIDIYKNPRAFEGFEDVFITPHWTILLGRGLIKNLQEFLNRKKKKKLPTERGYFKTFYTLDTCAILRRDDKAIYKSIIYFEHEVVNAVDYEMMHGLYTKPCNTFNEVLYAEDKYPEHVYSEDKGVKKPGMYHDIVITFIKKTNRGTPIKKEQVSKYRGIYNSIVDGIVTSIKSAQTELYA